MSEANIVRRGRAGQGARRTTARRERTRRSADLRGSRTRTQLIEIAGQVFAEQGFDRATGKDICARAGVHPAAIVYHFGGMDGLYAAVLSEARRRLITTEALAAAVQAAPDPARKLQAFLGLIVGALTSPVSRSWAGRLFGREFISPSQVYGRAHDQALAQRAKILKSIVSELTGLPADDPAVARACINIMAPCAVLLLFNRRKLLQLLPGFELGHDAASHIAHQLTAFAVAGLAAITRRD